MVVGNGLLATAFKDFYDDSKILIFASGISNSRETEEMAYKREVNLINQNLELGLKFVYFSTVSIYDQSLKNSTYVKHKIEIEKHISSCSSEYLIFRLPTLIGKTSNPHTLANYLFNSIQNEQLITVFNNACRYIIDVDDISILLSQIIRRSIFQNCILDINFNNAIFVRELIGIFEDVLSKKAITEFTEGGDCYPTSNLPFLTFLKQIKYELDPFYNHHLIKKYYQNRSLMI